MSGRARGDSALPGDRPDCPPGVLIATSTFPLAREDGTPRFVHDLAQALAAHYPVSVLAPDAPGARRRQRMDAVEVTRFTYFWPRKLQRLAYGGGMPENLRQSLLARLQVAPFLIAQVLAIRRAVRSGRIAVVNSHWLVPQGLAAAWARGARGRFRHLLHVHAADVYMLRRLPFGRALARFVLARTDAVFAAGSHVRETLDELKGGPAGAVLQPMGVELELFRAGGGEPVAGEYPQGFLLFVGRLVEKKGVVYLLRALPEVRRRHPGLGLVLIGYGPLEQELRGEVSRLGLEGAVRFAGRRTHSEVVRYLKSCRAAVVPSIVDSRGETEGMPTVVVEIMAAGARVVASAVDGIPDVVQHRVNGWLCREKDPADLAEKILAALEDRDPSPVVEAALETARRHDWSAVALSYRNRIELLRTAGEGREAER